MVHTVLGMLTGAAYGVLSSVNTSHFSYIVSF